MRAAFILAAILGLHAAVAVEPDPQAVLDPMAAAASPAIAAMRFRVTGRVQGVHFRVYTRAEARRLGLTGWVKNADDGAVIGYAEGAVAALADLRLWLRMKGSPSSRIATASFETVAPSGAFTAFDIDRTSE